MPSVYKVMSRLRYKYMTEDKKRPRYDWVTGQANVIAPDAQKAISKVKKKCLGGVVDSWRGDDGTKVRCTVVAFALQSVQHITEVDY